MVIEVGSERMVSADGVVSGKGKVVGGSGVVLGRVVGGRGVV
jgi:hypothetical protein